MEEALPQLRLLVLGTDGDLDVIRHVSIFVSTLFSFSTALSTHFMQLEKVIKQCRSDDAGKVKAMILKLIPNVNDIPAIDDDLLKHCRGFHIRKNLFVLPSLARVTHVLPRHHRA